MSKSAAASLSKTATAKTDKDPVYRVAVSELKTLRTAIEQSTGKWSLTTDKAPNTVAAK